MSFLLGADKIKWIQLSLNKNAIFVLEQNMNKIDYNILFRNENIFELDLKFIKNCMNIISKELMMKIYDPTRFERYMNIGYDIASDTYIDE